MEPRLRDRTVTVNGCSKAYAMTGWRMDFAGAPPEVLRAIAKLPGQSTSNACPVAQAAALAALEGPGAPTAEMRRPHERRRDRVVPMLDATPGLRCHMPESAFYAFST